MTKDELMKMARDAGIQAGFDYEFRGGYESMPLLEKEPVMQIERFANAILERAAVECEGCTSRNPWYVIRALKIPEGE